ncbi:MAG TPA: hypothetical protein VFK05_30370 [Polyangiaceae bacterium]|nr:hypothetical protein [Polyangiaceae bacterium]
MTTARIHLLAWSLAAFLLACGSGTTGENAGRAGSGSQSNSSDAGAGGAHTGAGAGAGGAQAAGASGSHSAGNGGSANSGGGAGIPGCHTPSDCPSSTPTNPVSGVVMCLSPGQATPSPGCGAPQWCGQCNCPPQPTGDGMPCQTNADCPAPNATAQTASLCNAGACTACTQNSDCPSTLPKCGSVMAQFSTSFQLCTACAADSDCPSERPYCQGSYGVTACVACRTTTDCASGVCASGVCVSQCTANAQCGEAMECSSAQRCQPLSCQSDADCPTNRACTNGYCSRRACTSDAVCQGACVNGGCYDSLGRCFVYTQAP